MPFNFSPPSRNVNMRTGRPRNNSKVAAVSKKRLVEGFTNRDTLFAITAQLKKLFKSELTSDFIEEYEGTTFDPTFQFTIENIRSTLVKEYLTLESEFGVLEKTLTFDAQVGKMSIKMIDVSRLMPGHFDSRLLSQIFPLTEDSYSTYKFASVRARYKKEMKRLHNDIQMLESDPIITILFNAASPAYNYEITLKA